jgi:hypothetical protein
MAHHFGEQFRLSPIIVNGTPGLMLDTRGTPSVIAFSLNEGRITAIDIIRNPEKLKMLPVLDGTQNNAPAPRTRQARGKDTRPWVPRQHT